MGELSPHSVQTIVVGMIIFLLSIAVHEFGHAFVADRLGDRIPRAQGRVTLNPVAHADPFGTILLPFIFLATTGQLGFAWGKPVEHLSQGRRGDLLIAFAGPAMNVVLAVIVAVISILLVRYQVIAPGSEADTALRSVVFFNFILFFFNLVPARPLDGGTVVRGLVPESWVDAWDEFTVYAPFIFIAILLIPKMRVIFTRPAAECSQWVFTHLTTLIGG